MNPAKMAEIWMYFHKAPGAVKCNGCAFEASNSSDSSARVQTLWAHLRSAHRDVYERSSYYATLGSPTTVSKVCQSRSNLPSEVWNYFEKVSADRIRCKLCSHEMTRRKSGRTSNYWEHLKSHHVEAYQSTNHFKVRIAG